MKKTIIAAAVAAVFSASAYAQNLGFEDGNTSGWTSTTLTAVGSTTTQAGSNTWVINPYGNYMGQLQIQSGNFNQMTSALGLTSSSSTAITTLLQQQAQTGGGNPNPTTAGWVTREVTLTAGQTFTLAWQYVSVDYVPFNDGSIATLTQSGTSNATVNNYNQQYALLGFTNPGTGDYSTGSYGATGWQVATFQVSQDGTYTLGFGVFNLGDTALSPVLYIDEVQGTTTKNGQTFGAVAPNNDTAPSSPAVTPPSPPPPPPQVSTIGSGTTEGTGNLASAVTVNGGTIQISSNNITLTNTFTVNNGGMTVDQNGNVSTFDGVISGTGGVTISNTSTGGGVTFTAVNTYTGTTTVNSGASLTNTGTIAGTVTNLGAFTNSGTAGNITNGFNGDGNTASLVNSGTVGNVTNYSSFANSGTTGNVTNVGTFTNTGTVNEFTNIGVLNNNAGGVIDNLVYNNFWIVNNGTINTVTYNGGSVFNHGTIGTINNSEAHGNFNNYGTVTGNVTTNSTFNNDATGVVQGLYTNTGILNNAGTVGAVINGGTFDNTGTAGAVTLISGTFTNTGTAASVDNTAGLTFTNDGTITGQLTNAGTVTNNGNVGNVNNTGTYTNNGTTGNWTNSGTISNSGTMGDGTNSNILVNDGTIGSVTSSGTFTNNGTAGAVILTGGTFANTGTAASVDNTAGLTFTNAGIITGLLTNNGTVTNNGNVGSVNNTGTYTNAGTTGNWINSGTMTNNGTAGDGTNSGTFNNTGTVGAVTNTGWFTNAVNAIAGFITNSFNFTNNGTVGNVDNTGTFINNGTTGDWTNSGIITNNGTMGNGTNSGSYTNNGTVGDVTNTGTMTTSGTAGIITNSGTLTQTGGTASVNNTGNFIITGGTLNSYVQTVPGTTGMLFEAPIAITNNAELGGGLTVNNSPIAYGRYTILTAGNVEGSYNELTSNGVNDYLKYSGTDVKLYVTPSKPATQTSINNVSNSLGNAINLNSSVASNGLGSDCSVFGESGTCVSVNLGQTAAAGGDLNTGGITLGKRINDNWRVGVFANTPMNSTTVGSIETKPNTAYGGYIGWNKNTDGTGLGITASAAQGNGSMKITRNGPEVGIGTSNTDTKAYQIRATYAVPVNETVTVTPYVGVRRTETNVSGYTEQGPVFPLTVNSTSQSATDVIAGATVGKQFTDKLSGSVTAGVIQTVSQTNPAFAGTSEIGGMSTFNGVVPNNGKTNPALSAGLGYNINKTTRVGASVGWQQRGANADVTTIGISLTKGF